MPTIRVWVAGRKSIHPSTDSKNFAQTQCLDLSNALFLINPRWKRESEEGWPFRLPYCPPLCPLKPQKGGASQAAKDESAPQPRRRGRRASAGSGKKAGSSLDTGRRNKHILLPNQYIKCHRYRVYVPLCWCQTPVSWASGMRSWLTSLQDSSQMGLPRLPSKPSPRAARS